MSVITISRQLGSLGDEIAEALSHKLGWELITRDRVLTQFFKGTATPYELHMLNESAKFYLRKTKEDITFLEHLERMLRDFTEKHPAVFVDFGSQMIFAEDKDALHIRVVAPQNTRIVRIKKQYRISDAEAGEILSTSDKKHRKFVSTLFESDLTEDSHYNLILNTAAVSVYECVAVIYALYRERELSRQIDLRAESMKVISNTAEFPVLKNASESEFAKILDMYQIDWKYEPKTFPIEWDAEGNVTLAFSPDFYLTKFDTYIELTTMNQKYITKKNKKIKKLRELYPGTNIKIVNKKDFYLLVERFKPVKGE